MSKHNDYPIDPTGPLTVGTIPDADLDRLIAATIPAGLTIEPPAGTEASDWQHDERGTYRLLYGISRSVPARADITVQSTAVQLIDGTIDGGDIEAPGVHVEVGGHPLTVAQSRELAAVLLAAVGEIDGWQDGSGAR